jgi:hypothetical protein
MVLSASLPGDDIAVFNHARHVAGLCRRPHVDPLVELRESAEPGAGWLERLQQLLLTSQGGGIAGLWGIRNRC